MRRPNYVALKVIGLTLGLVGGGAAIQADVVTVVSVKSPITTLSKSQISAIFLGKTNRFPDGSLATPIDQREASSIRDEFYDVVTGQSSSQMKAYWSKLIFTGRGQPPQTVGSSDEVKKLLAQNRFALGYVDASQVDSSVRVLHPP